MAYFDTSKLKFDSDVSENVRRGNYKRKDEAQKEVIFVPDENGKFLMSIR